MSRKAPIVVVGFGLAVSVGLVARAATDDPGGRSREVEGPAVGPSGQTGELTWLENPAKPYAGGATAHGPYRLLPPGTLYIPRDYPGDTGSRTFGETSDTMTLTESSLHIEPVEGYKASSERGTTRGGTIISIDSVWAGPTGETILVSSARVPDWMLPLDVYLFPQDSILKVVSVSIAGRPAIVEQPVSGPAPNVGHVRLWFDGSELVLRSPSVGQDRLVALAEEIARQQ